MLKWPAWRNTFTGRSRRCRKPLKRVPSEGLMAIRDWVADLKATLVDESPLIVDGGAAGGQTIKRLLSAFRDPTIHAFEPLPQRAEQLTRRFGQDRRIRLHPKALGPERGMVAFHVTANLNSSSALKAGPIARTYHEQRMAPQDTITVPQVRLDEVLEEPVDMLKLDLQGYELQALRGAERLLPKIRTIVTEVEFVPLYEGQALFAEIDSFLRCRGFRLLNLYDLWTHTDGQLTTANAVYLDANVFGPRGVPSLIRSSEQPQHEDPAGPRPES